MGYSWKYGESCLAGSPCLGVNSNPIKENALELYISFSNNLKGAASGFFVDKETAVIEIFVLVFVFQFAIAALLRSRVGTTRDSGTLPVRLADGSTIYQTIRTNNTQAFISVCMIASYFFIDIYSISRITTLFDGTGTTATLDYVLNQEEIAPLEVNVKDRNVSTEANFTLGDVLEYMQSEDNQPANN